MQDEAMPMSDVDTSVFQPLVDLGFEQEVRTNFNKPHETQLLQLRHSKKLYKSWELAWM